MHLIHDIIVLLGKLEHGAMLFAKIDLILYSWAILHCSFYIQSCLILHEETIINKFKL